MFIMVNGETQTVGGSETTISELLVLNKVSTPDMVSVQINGQFVDKKDFWTKKIAEKDEVDFLYFIGGGRCYERLCH